MKKWLFIGGMFFVSVSSYAQTWSEWFQQKKTQIKYLVEQIAVLKVYTGYVQKGYEIAHDGLNTINDIKHGDFFLHEGHFDSLKVVNPRIKSSAQVADIILIENRIAETSKKELHNAKESRQFTADEISYLDEVYSNIIMESSANVDQLNQLTTDGDLQMTDNERMKRIESIYLSIQDKYVFVKAFSKQTQLLAIQRIKSKSETDMVRKYYGIK